MFNSRVCARSERNDWKNKIEKTTLIYNSTRARWPWFVSRSPMLGCLRCSHTHISRFEIHFLDKNPTPNRTPLTLINVPVACLSTNVKIVDIVHRFAWELQIKIECFANLFLDQINLPFFFFFLMMRLSIEPEIPYSSRDSIHTKLTND